MSDWFSHHALAGAATARRNSISWRIGYSVICACSMWLITGDALAAAALCALVVGCMLFEGRLAAFYLGASGKRRDYSGVAFAISALASIASYTLLAGWGALHGGVPGQLAAMLMTSASIINLVVLLVETPRAIVLSVAPGAALLLTLPLLRTSTPNVDPFWAACGLYLAIISFASQALRTAKTHAHLFTNLTQAKLEAERRRSEAEHGRAAAEQSRLEAEKANQLKTEFLCTVTHELRTPLNAVINYSEMIVEEADGVIAEDANRITRSARHLLSLIERIMDFANLEAGDVNLEPAPLDADALVRQMVENHRPHLEAGGNTISIVTAHARAMADQNHVRTCLEGLLSNAAKFTANGRIDVSVTEREGVVRISVRDTGPGMSADALERAFKAFAQSDGRAHGAEGLGLGLAAARRTARLMGGDITATSTPGEGSCFTLSLPAALASPAGVMAAA